MLRRYTSRLTIISHLLGFVAACDTGTGQEKPTYVTAETARPLWFAALHRALDTKLDTHGNYLILRDAFLNEVVLVSKNNISIECDPILGIQIVGFVAGDDVPAASLGLVGSAADLDNPELSVPDIDPRQDKNGAMNLMSDLCVEVADAVERKFAGES